MIPPTRLKNQIVNEKKVPAHSIQMNGAKKTTRQWPGLSVFDKELRLEERDYWQG
jgi:hypothetical protein